MGSRDRRDPVGHKQRARNGSKIAAAGADAVVAGLPDRAPEGVPVSRSEVFATAIAAGHGRDPRVTDLLLEVVFIGPSEQQTMIRFPARAWEGIRAVIDDAHREAIAGESKASGLVVGGDVKSEAALAEQRAAAERKARGGQS